MIELFSQAFVKCKLRKLFGRFSYYNKENNIAKTQLGDNCENPMLDFSEIGRHKPFMRYAMEKRLIILFLFALVIPSVLFGQAMPSSVQALHDHIAKVMPQTVRHVAADDGQLIGLPKPYSVPCIRGAFQEMYYWDTYFTNVGLLLLGDVVQAQNNVDDILYLVDRFGYMPNGSHRGLLNRSQPPYASFMVRAIYEKTHNNEWLAKAVEGLEKEYEFWMTHRLAPNGLNRYGHEATEEELLDFYTAIAGRLRVDASDQKIDRQSRIAAGAHWLAEAESGWDFNARYDQRCMDFNPVDLNANLYLYELNFAWFYKQLGREEAAVWKKRAAQRRKLLNKYCLNEADGLFYDYDSVNNRRSMVLSGGVFNLLFAGVVTKKQARTVQQALHRLEMEHGVAACEPGLRKLTYQWDYPNAWAAINYMAIAGLHRYGFKSDARRLAQKYLESNVQQFQATGVLWEKYNAVTGNNDAAAEYGTPGDFMGWTAGTVLYCINYLYLHK